MIYFKHKSFEEIYNNLDKIVNFSILEFIILWIVIFLVVISIFYISPSNQIIFKIRKNKKDARKRKKLLNQIMAQKELENEIEEEIKNLNQKS